MASETISIKFLLITIQRKKKLYQKSPIQHPSHKLHPTEKICLQSHSNRFGHIVLSTYARYNKYVHYSNARHCDYTFANHTGTVGPAYKSRRTGPFRDLSKRPTTAWEHEKIAAVVLLTVLTVVYVCIREMGTF